jgi:hypothetical protein
MPNSIAAGDGTAPWCLGKTPTDSQYEAYYWDSGWQGTGEYGTAIALMNTSSSVNIPLLLTDGPQVIYGSPSSSDIGHSGVTFTWADVNATGCGTSISGAGYDSGHSLFESVFVTGCSAGSIESSNKSSGSWSTFAAVSPAGAGTQVSVSNDTTQVWAITSGTTNIYYQSGGLGGTWENVSSGTASSVAAAVGTNAAWIIGTSGDLYSYAGGSSPWTRMYNNTGGIGPDGIAAAISIGYTNGYVYIVDTNHDVWTYY